MLYMQTQVSANSSHFTNHMGTILGNTGIKEGDEVVKPNTVTQRNRAVKCMSDFIITELPVVIHFFNSPFQHF